MIEANIMLQLPEGFGVVEAKPSFETVPILYDKTIWYIVYL